MIGSFSVEQIVITFLHFVAWLLFLGLLPVGILVWMSVRRHRNRVEAAAEAAAQDRSAPSDSAQ